MDDTTAKALTTAIQELTEATKVAIELMQKFSPTPIIIDRLDLRGSMVVEKDDVLIARPQPATI